MQADQLVIVHDPSARRIQSSLDRCHFVADERIHFRMLQLRQINLTPAQQKPRSRNNTFGEEGVRVRPARRASGGGVHSTGPGAIAGSAMSGLEAVAPLHEFGTALGLKACALILLQFLSSGRSVGPRWPRPHHGIPPHCRLRLAAVALPFGPGACGGQVGRSKRHAARLANMGHDARQQRPWPVRFPLRSVHLAHTCAQSTTFFPTIYSRLPRRRLSCRY